MLTLICISTFATVCLLVIGATMKGERAILHDRVERLRLLMDQDIEMVAPELSRPFGERVTKPWLEKLAALAARFLPGNIVANTNMKLQRAGNPKRLKAAEFIGLKVLSAIIFTVIGIAAAVFLEAEPMYRVLAAIIGIVVGLTLPDSILDHIIRERQRLVRKSLADCLDLLVVSAEAGLGFDGAVAKVVEKMKGPLAEEFNKALQDMSVGRTRMEALRAMAQRINMPEMTTFVAAIHQADMLGVSISHVLRVQAESLRSLRNLRAREAAAKLPVKLLFPLVFCIFPAIFIVLLGPGAITIYHALSGIK